MTRTACLPIAVAALACMPLAAIAQPLDTPGVTSPLTAAQIARENPPNVLTGAAVDKPVVLKSAGGVSVRVVKLAEGLSHPDGLVFLPDGHTMLIAERPGRLRVVKDGMLDPTPVAGLPDMDHVALGGLQDVVLHPDFAKNHFLYLSYSKNRLPQLGTTLAVARARYDQGRLTEVN
jgi:glucose/arabinose dehydrogenase